MEEEYAWCCQVVLYTKSELNFHPLYILGLNIHLLLHDTIIIALYTRKLKDIDIVQKVIRVILIIAVGVTTAS